METLKNQIQNAKTPKSKNEIYFNAKKKAESLGNRQMIRLFSDNDCGYFLYKDTDIIYIGSYINGADVEMKNLFKNREVIWLQDEMKQKYMKFQEL